MGALQVLNLVLDRLRAILHLKELGLTLAEIALLLSECDHGVLAESDRARAAQKSLMPEGSEMPVPQGLVVARID